MIINKDTNLFIYLMEEAHPKGPTFNTVILGVRFQHTNFGRTKHKYTYTQSHALPYRNIQLWSHALTHTYSPMHGYTDPVTYACTHTLPPYFHTNTH